MGPQLIDVNNSNSEWLQEKDDASQGLVINRRSTILTGEVLDNMTNTGDPTAVDALENTIEDDGEMDLPDLVRDTGKDMWKLQQQTPLIAQGTHSIVEVCVSGFVPIKHTLTEIKDMAFVVEVTWSDGRTHMIKRTFSDFYNFHFYLLDEFKSASYKQGPLRLTFYLPGWYRLI